MDLESEINNDLWKLYKKSKLLSIRDEIILKYMTLVKYIAYKLSMYFSDYIEKEDLISYGIFGLIDAIEKYDINKGVKFETYASSRIRGAIIDNIRKEDLVPRSIREKEKLIKHTMFELENKLGRQPLQIEIAEELEMDINKYNKMVLSTNVTNTLSLESLLENNYEVFFVGDNFNVQDLVEEKDLMERILKIIEEMPEIYRKVIILYYYKSFTLKQIAKIMESSESRISKINSKAIKYIRNKIEY